MSPIKTFLQNIPKHFLPLQAKFPQYMYTYRLTIFCNETQRYLTNHIVAIVQYPEYL